MAYDRGEVARRLQAVRKESGYKSARSFAEVVGMNVSTYTDFEQGHRPLSCERAWQFADALGCSIDALIGRDWQQEEAAKQSSEERDIAERYAALPRASRKAVRDMITVQENELEKTETISGDEGWAAKSA